MADLREVLGKYVPQHVLDSVVEEVQEAATPETFRKQLGELGAKAKRADELEAELNNIKAGPQRDEAYSRVGLPTDLPKYARDWLDSNVPIDKLGDLDFVASKVQEGGFQVDLSQVQAQPRTNAEQISAATVEMGTGRPARVPGEQAYEAAVAAAKSPEELDQVYRDFGKAPAEI